MEDIRVAIRVQSRAYQSGQEHIMSNDTTHSKIDLSIVIPTLNEVENLEVLLPQLKNSLESLEVRGEILVVDGDSKDGTEEVCTVQGIRFLCEGEGGYGAALRRGIAEASGVYVITMDADLSHPAHVIKDLWDARDAADVIIASRYVEGGRAEQPWVRLMLSRLLNWIFRRRLSLHVRDLSSGFRLYKKDAVADLDLRYTNFVILIEILAKSHEKGMRIHEIPFHYQPRRAGSSKARIVQFGKDYLRLLVSLRKP